MATLQERLTEAQDAYHRLVIGQAAVRIRDADGSEVTYTQANRPALKAYISDLDAQIAAAAAGTTLTPGPMRLIF